MTDKEKIINEINRRLDAQDPLGCTEKDIAVSAAYKSLKEYIKSLSEEPVSEDLLGIAIELEETIGTSPHSRLTIVEHLVKAVNWQKEQMMKNAIDAEVQSAGCFIPLINAKEYNEKLLNVKFGDKVKLIIIKED